MRIKRNNIAKICVSAAVFLLPFCLSRFSPVRNITRASWPPPPPLRAGLSVTLTYQPGDSVVCCRHGVQPTIPQRIIRGLSSTLNMPQTCVRRPISRPKPSSMIPRPVSHVLHTTVGGKDIVTPLHDDCRGVQQHGDAQDMFGYF